MAEEPEDQTIVGDRRALLSATRGDAEQAYVIVIAGPSVGEMFRVDARACIGRGEDAEIRLLDDQISRRHALLSLGEDGVVIEDLGSTNGTFVNGETVTHRKLTDGDKIQVGSSTILKFSYHDRLDEQFQRRMFESAVRDGLTKLLNKKHFWERLDAEVAYARRHGAPLSLMLFDLDHFKQINDEYGHLAGDRVLTTVAEQLLDAVRKEDVLARYGGEEFALLSRGIGKDGARHLADRVRRTVAGCVIEHEGRRIPVTTSVGVVTFPDAGVQLPAALVEAADKALYAAKNAGRNRVEVFEGA